jgi:hypothetical protein
MRGGGGGVTSGDATTSRIRGSGGGMDNWVWPWLSHLLMNRVKIWSLPRVVHVSSTDRNCMIFLSKFACRTRRDLTNLHLALPQ